MIVALRTRHAAGNDVKRINSISDVKSINENWYCLCMCILVGVLIDCMLMKKII